PSTIRDQAGSDRLRPDEVTADWSGGAGGVDRQPHSEEAAPAMILETTPLATAPDAGGEHAGARTVPASPDPATSGQRSATGPVLRSAASRGETEPSASPAEEATPVMGPPAPGTPPTPPGHGAPPGPPAPSGPPTAPAPPREAFEGAPDRTGVTDKTIRIGIHAPVTGAAPFPQSAFE